MLHWCEKSLLKFVWIMNFVEIYLDKTAESHLNYLLYYSLMIQLTNSHTFLWRAVKTMNYVGVWCWFKLDCIGRYLFQIIHHHQKARITKPSE